MELHPLGAKAKHTIEIAGTSVPLTSGQWTVIGTAVTKGRGTALHVSYMLARIDGRRLTGAIEVFVNARTKNQRQSSVFGSSGGEGWVTHRSCVRDDMHHREVHKNVRLGEQDCWWVNHWRMNRSGSSASEHWREATKFLEKGDIRAPLDMIGVSFRQADKRNYLTANYFFDPEIEGQITTKDIYWSVRTWMTSEWHPDRVKNDAQKTDYINKLVSWGRSWRSKIKAAFEAG